jgi:putative addiction module killer protein
MGWCIMIVSEYLRSDGSCPFTEWFEKLDGSIKSRVEKRLLQITVNSHWGVSKMIGRNLHELKFKSLGGGVRIYFGYVGDEIIILLGGGNKSTQEKDIDLVKRYWFDYLSRNVQESL